MNHAARKVFAVGLAIVWLAAACHAADTTDAKTFRAGAAEVDITPAAFPVIVNGMFEERTATAAHDRLLSRALVLDDGQLRLAIVVVDNLMMPRDLLDQTKEMARQATGIPVERMLISATHTHSSPSAMGCLGSGLDKQYQQFLPGQIAKSISFAAAKLAPARIGWTVIQDAEHNHCRRWVFRADRMRNDPFGQRNVRANMHPGYQSPQHIGPSGPEDTDLTLLSVQTRDGKPLAVLGNYAMHYYGSPLISGDFCGRFGARLAKLIGADEGDAPLVGMMSQGTSGDSMWPDYSKPANPPGLDGYTDGVARVAHAGYQQIEYHDYVSLAMAESRLTLRRRVPDEERLSWARQTLAKHGDKPLREQTVIYAREQIFLHEQPEVELKLQAIRIGDLGITAIPNEVFGITGWKLKGRSPLKTTFNIELANGAEGYIPPPEQHKLGGYTTWAARTAALEVEAEPKIVAALLELLEKVAGKPRKTIIDESSDYAKAVLASRPAAYWRLGEIEGQQAVDAAGKLAGKYEDGVALYLPGDTAPGMSAGWQGNRAAHFAGGRMQARIEPLGEQYSVEGWIWNGLPHDARAVTGAFFSRGEDGARDAAGDHVGICGTFKPEWAGKLMVFNGNARDETLVGRTVLELKTWRHVVFTRDGQRVAVYLDGNRTPEIAGDLANTGRAGSQEIFLGGRSDKLFGWEGKLDEFALYNRVLTPDEVAAHYAASGNKPNQNAQAIAPAAPAPPTAALVPDPPPKSLRFNKPR